MKRTETVSLRIDAKTRGQIDAAREPFGVSRGEFVRSIVIRHLSQPASAEFAQEISSLRQAVSDLTTEVRTLQVGLTRMAFALLANKLPLPTEDARARVRKWFTSQADE